MLHARLRAAAGNRGGIPTDGLVAWYTMDNISGSTLIDETGNYDGAITGASQTSGIIGQALSFDAVDDYVATPARSGQSGAVSFWINLVGTGRTRLFVQSNTATNVDYLAARIENSKIQILYNGTDLYSGTTELSTSVWYHVILQSDGSATKFYLDTQDDGITIDSGSDSGSWFSDVANPDAFDIGRFNRAAGPSYDGEVVIDQWREYNRTLTDAERTALYNEGA